MKKIYFLMLLVLVASSFAACEVESDEGEMPEEAEEIKEIEESMEVSSTDLYQDEYISFTYPEDVELYALRASNPQDVSKTIDFMVWDEETGSYDTVGIQMEYIYNLSLAEYGIEAEYDYEGLKEAYENADMEPWEEGLPVYEEFDFGDREGFIVRSLGMGAGYYIDLYIPFSVGDDANSYQVFKIGRNSLSFEKEMVEEIISLFVETAMFYQ